MEIQSVLALKARGPEVGELQRLLNYILKEQLKPPLVIDGIFGLRTDQAVRLFQRLYQLKEDGIVGPLTRHALYQAYQNKSNEEINAIAQLIEKLQIELVQMQQAYRGVNRAKLEAKKEIDKIMTGIAWQRVIWTGYEMFALGALTGGLSSSIRGVLLARRIVSSQRLASTIASLSSIIIINSGRAIVDTILKSSVFTWDNFIDMLKDKTLEELKQRLSKSTNKVVEVIEAFHTLGMAYLEEGMKRQARDLEIELGKKITLEKVRSWLVWNMRYVWGHEQHLHRQIRAYQKYSHELIWRKRQIQFLQAMIRLAQQARSQTPQKRAELMAKIQQRMVAAQ